MDRQLAVAGPAAAAVDGSPEAARPASLAFRLAFIAAASIVSVLFLVVDYLPGSDLPQHAMQVSALRQDFPFLHVHWLTPYALAYAFAYVLSFVVGAKLAVTLVALIAVLAVPLALLLLVEDPWWALAGFPAALGYAFYKGLWPFTVAVPLVLVLLWATSRRRAGLAGLLALLLVAAHAQAAAFGIAIAAGTAMAQRQWRSALALAPAAVLLGAWLLLGSLPGGGSATVQGDGLARRLVQLPALIVGGEPPGAAFAIGAAIVVVLLWAGRPAPLARCLPLAAALAAVLFAPRDISGVGYIYPRFAVFVVPLLAFALRPQRRAGGLVAAVVALWFGVTVAQWRAWDGEAAELHAVLETAEPGRRLLYLAFDHRSRAFMTASHGGTGTWYATQRGGWAEFSFAASAHEPVRYRDGYGSVPIDVVSRPRWEPTWAGSFDYVLARGRAIDAPGLRPVVQRGPWRLYAVAARSTGDAPD